MRGKLDDTVKNLIKVEIECKFNIKIVEMIDTLYQGVVYHLPPSRKARLITTSFTPLVKESAFYYICSLYYRPKTFIKANNIRLVTLKYLLSLLPKDVNTLLETKLLIENNAKNNQG